MTLSLGTAKAKRGQIVYGEYDLVEHPVGGVDRLPVIIAQGSKDGPTFWITAGIHGGEHAGVQVIHKLITPDLIKNLHGTIISIPALNPAGLRTLERQAYYYDGDPNRLFPDGRERKLDPDKNPPSSLELAYGKLFDEIKKSANYFFDLHCMSPYSLSFVFRDRLLYRKGDEAAKKRAEATSAKMEEMAQAYGHTIIADFSVSKYIDEKLHRSSTAAAASLLGIPSLTAELGSLYTPDPHIVKASLSGLRNVLRWAKMLKGDPEPISGIKIVDAGFNTRRRNIARVSQPCVAHHWVEPGDRVRVGDPVVEMRDVWGRVIGILKSEYEGFVISRPRGIFFYPGQATLLMAIKDDEPLVGEYPEKFFE